MNRILYILAYLAETLLRFSPLPCRTGLRKIGNPDRSSPVFLTCNYHLTVIKVKRALQGIDAYLLIANSRGINVWCAAAGGLFTDHSVISALKTSGIEEAVDHRKLILPQLAATGVQAGLIKSKTGWKVIWGPVYARDIPAFFLNQLKKTPEMREVEFPWTQRLEMAAAWAFPVSMLLALIVLPFRREAVLGLICLVWGLSLFIFLSFPLYRRWPASEGRRAGFVFFDFGRGGFQLILWAALVLGVFACGLVSGALTWQFVLRWGFAALVVVLLLSIDLMGSTPLYKSGLHKDRNFKVALDEGKCRGAAFCKQVCPRNCHKVDKKRHKTSIPLVERCVQCGACIVQCPFDALYFRGPKGEIIPAESVRKFKLNLMGRRR